MNRRLFVYLAGGLTVLASACSGSQVTAPLGPTADVEDLAFADEPLTTFRLAMVRPDSWDPARVSLTNQGAVVVADLLHDGLTEAGPNGELRPGLALSWRSSPDFTTWTFELDASRVSAQEVVASFDRLRAEAAESYPVVLLREVAAVEAVDAQTVEFRLHSPNAGFAWILSGVSYSVVTDDGTGIYESRQDDGESMSLVPKDPSSVVWRDKEPLTVEVSWVESGQAAFDAMATNQVHAAVVDPEQIGDAVGLFGHEPMSLGSVRFYGLNTRSPDLAEVETRRAVVAAIDQRALLNSSGSKGVESDGLTSTSTFGSSGEACSSACMFDPGIAQQLLGAGKESQQAPGELVVVFDDDGQMGTAEQIVSDLTSVGFSARAEQVPREAIPGMISDGSADLFAFGWTPSAGSIDSVIAPMFRSGSGLNVTGLLSNDVDALLTEAALEGSDVERWELLAGAHKAALDSGVAVPVAAVSSKLIQSGDSPGVDVRPDGSIDAASLVAG